MATRSIHALVNAKSGSRKESVLKPGGCFGNGIDVLHIGGSTRISQSLGPDYLSDTRYMGCLTGKVHPYTWRRTLAML